MSAQPHQRLSRLPVPYDERAIATGRRHGPAVARVGDGRDPARVFVQSFHESALGDVPDHQPANLVADQQMLAIGREDRGCELENLRRKIWPDGERGKIPDLELAGLIPILMTRGHQEPPVRREGHAVDRLPEVCSGSGSPGQKPALCHVRAPSGWLQTR